MLLAPACRLPVAAKPGTNVEFWSAKLEGNVARDDRVKGELIERGWRTLTVWECEVGDLVTLPTLIASTSDQRRNDPKPDLNASP